MKMTKVFSNGKVLDKNLYEKLQVLDRTTPSFKGCENEFKKNREWWVIVKNRKIVAYCGSAYSMGVCIFIRAFVDRTMRGKGIQKLLIKKRLLAAKKNSSVAITYTTIDNYPSVNNLMSCGFKYYNPEYAYAGQNFLYFRKEI